MVAAYKSLLMHSDVALIYLLIEDDSFPYELPDCVKTVNVSSQREHWSKSPNARSEFTYMALVRSTYAIMFPWLDKILSLDVDTIVNEDISDLWDIDLGRHYFSASPEWHKTIGTSIYTNIGVCLYNLKKLRNDGKVKEVIDELTRREHRFLEQDAFNFLCQGAILPMNGDYNANAWVKYSDHPKIIHYAGIKDWMEMPDVLRYQSIPLEEVLKARPKA